MLHLGFLFRRIGFSGCATSVALQYGETPLHQAARHASLEFARLFVEEGANVNAMSVVNLKLMISRFMIL
jgi:hypothetical protein